jgi:hypothetical protein
MVVLEADVAHGDGGAGLGRLSRLDGGANCAYQAPIKTRRSICGGGFGNQSGTL